MIRGLASAYELGCSGNAGIRTSDLPRRAVALLLSALKTEHRCLLGRLINGPGCSVITEQNFPQQRTETANEVVATTEFVTDKSSTTSKPADALDIPRDYVLSNSTMYQQDVRDFLEKPIIVASGTITTGTTGVFETITLPDDMLIDPLYSNKLSGYGGVRGTIRIKFCLNANPYQQGRILMAFIPLAQIPNALPNIRLQNLTTITQLPHVEMDFSCDREMEIDIPYTSPGMYYDTSVELNPWGQLFCYIYSPLKVGTGVNTVTYTAFASFVKADLILMNPCIDTSVSERIRKRRESHLARSKLVPHMKVVARRSKKKAPTEHETEALAKGPVSSALATVSSVAGSLGRIPLLSTIAGPVSWAASVASGLASAFGYSRPTNEEMTARMVQNVAAYPATGDGLDSSQPLGLSVSNKIQVLPGFAGSNRDEMSFDHLVQIPTYVSSFNWTTSTVEGTALYGTYLSPNSLCVLSLMDGGVPYFQCTPLGFLASLFKFCRGNIRFKFKLIKTDSHSGRLVVAFNPINSAPFTLDESSYLHRTVIDISMGNEFEVECPFVYSAPYMTTDSGYGYLRVFVLTALTCPDVVANNIDVKVEVSGAPGFEFQVPITDACFLPYVPSALRASKEVKTPEKEEAKPVLKLKSKLVPHMKSNKDDSRAVDACKATPTRFLGDSGAAPLSVDAAANCIGERPLSLLTLLKTKVATIILDPTDGSSFRPFATCAATSDGLLGSVVATSLAGDYYSLITSCYAYNRGGVRFLLEAPGSNGSAWVSTIDDGPDPLNPYTVDARVHDFARESFCETSRGLVEVTVPAYTGFNSRVVRWIFEGRVDNEDYYSDKIFLRTLFQNGAGEPQPISFAQRGVADDFQCGFFLGIPPLISGLLVPRT